jgi:hypothetical protein
LEHKWERANRRENHNAQSRRMRDDICTPAEARAIAREAYIYGFPMVDNYRIQYGYFVDRQNPEFKAP